MDVNKHRNFEANMIALLIAIIVFAVLYLLKPSYPFQPRGIILPMVQQLPDTSKLPIKVYDSFPINYKALAYVHAEAHTLNPNNADKQAMIGYAKQLAKKAGANGLVLQANVYQGPGAGNPAPLAKYQLLAIAIRTND